MLEDPIGKNEKLAAQISNICLLEAGIVFHSIFVGLTLAVSNSEFKTLYAVIVFHQMFEGLGLGARLERTPWSPGIPSLFHLPSFQHRRTGSELQLALVSAEFF